MDRLDKTGMIHAVIFVVVICWVPSKATYRVSLDQFWSVSVSHVQSQSIMVSHSQSRSLLVVTLGKSLSVLVSFGQSQSQYVSDHYRILLTLLYFTWRDGWDHSIGMGSYLWSHL